MKNSIQGFLFLTTILLPTILWGDVPERFEQVIYSIRPFDGIGYDEGTFCREEGNTIFLLADVNNFLTVRKTFVYFWPLTNVWEPDTALLNHEFSGQLELSTRRGERLAVLKQGVYTYFSTRGTYALFPEWQALSGDAAAAELDKMERLFREQQAALALAEERREQVQAALDRLVSVIISSRKRGEEPVELVQIAREYQEILSKLEKPVPPPWEALYVSPPAPLQKGFTLNLPAGEYRLCFIDEDERVLQGSVKKLIVFQASRKNLTGFDIKPGKKWNRPVQSTIPGSTIYSDGSTDLYLKPYVQEEVNEYYYNNLIRNGSRGNLNQKKLIKTGEVTEYAIRLRYNDGRSEVKKELPYIVQQSQGGSRGFSIIPYDESQHAGKQPHLSAVHVPLNPGERRIHLEVLEPREHPQHTNEREVRIVDPEKSRPLFTVWAFLPLMIYFFLLIFRSKKEH